MSSLETKLAIVAMGALMKPRMPAFKHFCKPCPSCNPPNPDCLTCAGRSTVCDCEAAWDEEGDRRYKAWRDGDYDHDCF